MLLRLQEFGDKLFEFTSIKFETKGFSEKFNDMHLEADSRRHFLLIFKEAMNNSLKYAACKTIELSAEMEENEICVCLEDDGVGFDPGTIKAGNGLKNMKEGLKKPEAGLILFRIIIQEQKSNFTSKRFNSEYHVCGMKP